MATCFAVILIWLILKSRRVVVHKKKTGKYDFSMELPYVLFLLVIIAKLCSISYVLIWNRIHVIRIGDCNLIMTLLFLRMD